MIAHFTQCFWDCLRLFQYTFDENRKLRADDQAQEVLDLFITYLFLKQSIFWRHLPYVLKVIAPWLNTS